MPRPETTLDTVRDWWSAHAEVLGWRARVGWLLHIWKAIVLREHGGWRNALAPWVEGDGVIVDVGAHGGQTTAAFAAIVPAGEVISFEPSCYTFSVLERALAFRRIGNATPVRLALSDAPGTMTLHTPVKANGHVGYGLASLEPTGRFQAYVTETIPVTTLDLFLADRPGKRIDLIKIDVEGAEHRVLAGARRTIEVFRPLLLVEIIEADSPGGRAVWDMLTALGYTGRALSPEGTLGPEQDGRIGGDILFTPRTERATA